MTEDPDDIDPEADLPLCYSCDDSTDNICGRLLHEASDTWICDECWAKMSPYERADLKLRLEEKASIDDVADGLQEFLENVDEDKPDPADFWKRKPWGGRN